MVELAAEPLYVLSQVQLRFKLRVSIDAVAHTAKAALTLLLLRFHMVGEVTAICLAQVMASQLFTALLHFCCNVASPLGCHACLEGLRKSFVFCPSGTRLWSVSGPPE